MVITQSEQAMSRIAQVSQSINIVKSFSRIANVGSTLRATPDNFWFDNFWFDNFWFDNFWFDNFGSADFVGPSS
jgi:hypothetical protein